MIMETENVFGDLKDGVNACFVISEDQKKIMAEVIPKFPQDRVIVAPNGINLQKFHPRDKSLETVLKEQVQTHEKGILWPKEAPSDLSKYKKLLAFVGKAAEWKRQAALLKAAKMLEASNPDLACVLRRHRT